MMATMVETANVKRDTIVANHFWNTPEELVELLNDAINSMRATQMVVMYPDVDHTELDEQHDILREALEDVWTATGC